VPREHLTQPEVVQKLVNAHEERLRHLHRWAARNQRRSVRDRILATLELCAIDFGRVTRDGCLIDLPLTHRFLAAVTNSTRSTVTRQVNDLIAERTLRLVSHEQRWRYLLPNSHVLERGWGGV